MSDLISRQATYLALVEKGQASKRYKLGETWELNGEEIREVLDALPSAQPEQSWIPCSDDNPKADGRYLITGKMGTVYSLDFEDGRWYGGIKPVAWMPLPEPYKGGEQDG